MKILSAEQMQRVDRLSTERCGIPGIVLMENAGFQLLSQLREAVEDLDLMRTVILCGPGNNGGDGLVLARHLHQNKDPLEVILAAHPDRLRGDAAANLAALRHHGAPIRYLTCADDIEGVRHLMSFADVIVDALLGTGVDRPLDPDGLIGLLVDTINSSTAFVLSVDMPSGMKSDSLDAAELTVRADLTVTFTAPKIAQILSPDLEALGELQVVPIGTPQALVEDDPRHDLNLLVASSVRTALPHRPAFSHKGSYGHVAVVAGSRGKSGAASLSAQAALRSGAGLVTALVPDDVLDIVATSKAEIMTQGLPSTERGALASDAVSYIEDGLDGKHSLVLGPGLGTDDETTAIIRRLTADRRTPTVLDADGINAFSGDADAMRGEVARPLVLTPHPGEFARLTDSTIDAIQGDRIELARDFARSEQVWLVLKGHRTLTAAPDGQVYACPLGNPGMASAGMGDVLSGILGALLAGCDGDGAAVTWAVNSAVYLHSLAGDLAAETVGVDALNAGDLLDALGQAFRRLRTDRG